MLPVTAHELCTVLGGTLTGAVQASVARVVVDSRGALRSGDVFFALQGPRFDGSSFAQAALDAGASVVVAPSVADLSLGEAQAAVRVDDGLEALQTLATHVRDRYQGVVVGITGSNGKTTVKDMLQAALGGSVRTYASPMSYNSQVGVALALVHLDPDSQTALIECGISQPGEMARLQRMVRPTHGIFVNVGDAHLAGLGDRETTAKEKAALFSGLTGWCLIPREEALAIAATQAVGADVVAVEGAVPDTLRSVFAPCGRLALEAAVRLGQSRAAAAAALKGWQAPPMRMEISKTPRGVIVINDAYTADPVSTDAALVALAQYPTQGRRVAVLGGMAQLGDASRDAHRAVGERVAELGLDLLIGVGAGGAAIVAAAQAVGMPEAWTVECTEPADAATPLEERVSPGDVVLLKASRPVGLERLAPVLFGAVEPARAYVDGEVLIQNVRRIEAAVGSDVTVMCVVKAFGYGLDAIRSATTLERAGARYFDVAIAEEAIALRDAGITTPILVQHVVPEDAPKIVRYGLTALVGTTAQLDTLARAAETARRRTRVHVKVDTGMARAGARGVHAEELAQAAEAHPWIELEGLMTHFAASDEPEQDTFTRAQWARFDAVRAHLEEQGITPRYVHACNSAAIARFPEAHATMVRTGLGLLGYALVDGAPMLGTQPVLRLTTRVVSTRWVEPGETVGYGRTWIADRRTQIAVVAMGYGDGYPRALSNKGEMMIADTRCPVVGRVCMDVTMVDITAVPTVVKAGDEVLVFGREPGEPDLCAHAALADTIPYEMLARLSQRVRRIFRGVH